MAKLSTCSCDVPASGGSNMNIDAMLSECVLEKENMLVFWTIIGEIFHFVISDEIDVTT